VKTAFQGETQLAVRDGKLGDIIQLTDGFAYELSLQGVRARARHFQPPRPRGWQAIDIDIPAAVELLVVDGGSAATERASCYEYYSHCAYFTKLYMTVPSRDWEEAMTGT
jgi:hypothetical protein